MLTLRFRNFPKDIARNWLVEIIELASDSPVSIVEDSKIDNKVDLEITGPYGGDSDDYKTPFLKRLQRFGYIKVSKGHHLSNPRLSAGLQPRKSAAKNIWFTGENQRPPQGTWDGFLSFDSKLNKSRNVYLPLWMLTSTDMMKSTKETFWGQDVPQISSLLKKRKFQTSKRKFCCSFVGKTYAMRFHAIEELSKISAIDVFGQSVRNVRKFPGRDARKYKFCLCFENDVYPGYVTEKPLEAYIAGTVPLYFGHDIEGYLNPKAMINLLDFTDITEWIKYVKKVHSNEKLYKYHFEQPILLRKPDVSDAVNLIRKILDC
jgi:hypothetical protein